METTAASLTSQTVPTVQICNHTNWARRFAEELPETTIISLHRLLARNRTTIEALLFPEDYIFWNANTNLLKTMYAECPECREVLRSVLKRRLMELENRRNGA